MAIASLFFAEVRLYGFFYFLKAPNDFVRC